MTPAILQMQNHEIYYYRYQEEESKKYSENAGLKNQNVAQNRK